MSARDYEPSGGVSGGFGLLLIASYLVGRMVVSPDASLIATTAVGMACLVIPVVVVLTMLLSASAHHPPRRRHHRGRYYR